MTEICNRNKLNIAVPKKRKKFLAVIIYFLLFAFLFTEGIHEGFITNTLTNAIAVVAMGVMVLYSLQKKSFWFDSYSVVFLLFTAFCFLSILWASAKSSAFGSCMVLLRLLVFFLLLNSFLIRENDIDTLIFVVCLSGIAYGIYYCSFYGVQNIVAALSEGARLGGDLDNANAVGCRFALCSILCIWYVVKKKKRWMLVGYFITLFGVLGSGSRTAVGICAMGTLLIILIGEQHKGFLKRILLLGVALAVVYIVLDSGIISGLTGRFDEMMLGLTGAKGDSSSKIRFGMIEYGWKQFLQTPVLGIGIGNTGQVAGLVDSRYAESYLHNNFIELLASVGITGTGIYYSFYIIPLKNIKKIRRKKNIYTTLCLALIAALLFGQLGSVHIAKKYIYMYILLIFKLTKTAKKNFANKEIDDEQVCKSDQKSQKST